jgi:hypothetical protein
MKFENKTLPRLRRALRKQIAVLDSAVAAFQEGQAQVPLPDPEDLARMQRGEIPLTREAYLIGVYQKALVATEDLALDLRLAIKRKTLKNIHEMRLSPVDFNFIQAGAERPRE